MKREINNFNEIPEFFPWKPTFNKVVITLNKLEPDNKLVLSDNTMSEEQYVVASGWMAEQYVKPGDKVLLDLEKMITTKPNPHDTHEMISTIKVEPIEYEDVTYAIIEDRYIKAIWRD